MVKLYDDVLAELNQYALDIGDSNINFKDLMAGDENTDVTLIDGRVVPSIAKRLKQYVTTEGGPVLTVNGEEGHVLVYKTFSDIEEMIAETNINEYKIYKLKSYFKDKNSGGGDFYYDASLKSINNGITIFNGWVRTYDVLTFEMGGVLLNDKTNQASRMNNVLLFMEKEGIKEVKFAGSGVLWLSASVKIPPRKVPSNRPVETGDDIRQWGYGNIAWQLDLSNVTFKPLVNDIELLVVHRDNVRLYGRYKAETGEDWGNLDGVGRKSGVTALRVGMLKAESDALNNAYYSLGTWFKADEIIVTGLQTAVTFQAGFAVFYPEITRLYARKTNYAVLFKSPDFDTYNQITRARIGYLQHEVGFCSLWGGCIETLIVDCYFGEDIKASKFTQPDPLSLISDGIATSFYFPDKDHWGKQNHKNMVFSGFLESADRLAVNDNYENEFRVKSVTVSQPSKGLVYSSGFGKESPIVEVNTLSNIQNYGNASLIVNITNAMLVNNPTIKLQLPDKNMPSLQGSLLLFPAELSGGVPWTRVEYLYVSTPATHRGLYFRKNDFRGNSPTDWILSSDINYLNSDTNATNLKTLSVSIKNNNNTTRPNYIILGKYRNVAGDTDYNTGHDFISGKFVFMRGDKWTDVSGQELQISLFQANGSLFGKLSTYNLFNRTTPVASQIDIIQYNNTKYIALKCASLSTLTTFAKYFSGESNMFNDDMFLKEIDSSLVSIIEEGKLLL